MKNTNLILTGVATVGLALSVANVSFAESPEKESKAAAADNTARNERDRDDKTQTPPDQGNSQADIDTTAKIRKDIMATKDLSVNAQNVKIITNQGKVTLRGPVASSDEKKLIGEIATKTTTKENVDNQLEVK